MRLSDFDYHLPERLIAQEPASPRDAARLLVFNRATGAITHARVRDLPSFLPPKTILAANDSRVRHSRLYASLGGKQTEILVIEPRGPSRFRCLLRGRNIKDGSTLTVYADAARTRPVPLGATVMGREDVPGMTSFIIEFTSEEGQVESAIERYGTLPLPPYITQSTAPEDRYQTVFAREIGSAAAPTAGLHFTPELIGRLRKEGHGWEQVTLHVGLGTFLPLRQETVEENRLHKEASYVSPETAASLNQARLDGRTVLAVGTTSTRTLESHAGTSGALVPGWKDTDLFIYPGYQFKAVTALLTNFHLPKSSLLMLVAAFLGNGPAAMSETDMAKTLMKIYEEAVLQEYRFFSFGDAMLIL